MSAFDAGRIVATADLDRSPFQRGLQDAKREAREFGDAKYSAKLDADTSEADRKVVDLRARLERLNAERINPKVDLEGVTAAEARLAGLQAQMHALDRSGGGRGGGLGGGSGGGFLSRFPKGPGLLGLAAGAALPMAGPLAAVGLGAGASFLAPTVAGGLGLGAFAAGAKSSFTAVGNDVKKLTQLQQRYNAASTDKQRAAVLRQEHALWQSLDPAQRKAVKNVDSLEASWKRYQKALEPQSFGVLAEGAQIAEKGLHLLLPTAKAVGNEVENLASRANTALSQPFWRHFFHDFLAVEAPIAVNILGTSLGNVVTGIAHLSERFAPLGHDLENMLSNTSGGFEKWTTGSGPAKFVAFVEKEGPIVARDLRGIVHALEGLGKGLSPIGQVELKALAPVLDFIGKVGNEHPGVITAVGTALLGVGAGLKVIAGVRGIQGVLGGISGLGRGGGGGGLPGGIGKGAPVPVYVTNWGGEGGGLPGGGGPVKTGKIATTVRDLGAVAGPAGALTAAFVAGANAYALTNKEALQRITHPVGADVGYSRYVQQYVSAKYPNAVGTPYYNQISAQALQHFSPRSGVTPFTPTDVPASVLSSIKHYQSNVDAAGKTAQDAGAKVKGLVGDTENLNIIMLKNPGVARKMEAGLRQLAAQAKIEGALVGGDLGQGLIQGVEALIPHANMAGKLLVASTVKSMRLAANAHSPSRETERLAVDMGLGLIVGWRKIAPQVNAAFAHGTTTGIKFIENAMARGVAATQARLNSARGQLDADKSARSGYIANLTSSYSGSANISGALNPNGSVGSVRGFLRSRLGKLRQFVDILHKLARRHLSPTLLQEVADQGPDGGIALGQSILAAGGIGDLNRLQRQIDSYARQGASFAGHAVYDPRIAADEKHVRELVHEVKLQRQELHDVLVAIRHNPAAFAHALADEFRNAQHRATAGGH